MPDLKTYDLFISHVWRYHDDYDRMVKLLDDAANFRWRNYSVPRHDPAIDPNTEAGFQTLKSALRRQIRPVNCVLILAGMYAAHSRWINVEMDLADELSKPMVGVRPWGQERIPQAVQDRVTEMVGWNTSTVVAAIRRWSL